MSRRTAYLMILCLATLTGCGVRSEAEPRDADLPFGPRPVPVSPVPSAAAAGTAAEPLYFVRGDRLVAVIRRLRTTPTLQQQVDHLLAGPSDVERQAQLSSALTGNVAVSGVALEQGRAVISVTIAGDESGRVDQVLAFGQIVCTLTARPDVGTVVFKQDGRPLGVPRADGSLSSGGLTAADYTALTAPA